MHRNIQRISLSSLILSKLGKSPYNPSGSKPNQITTNLSFKISHIFYPRPHYTYFTLVDKPIQSAALTSIIQFASQTLTYPFLQWSCPAEASVIIGGIAFRVVVELASKFIQEMKFVRHENRLIYRLVQKVFLVDLARDVKFYELDQRKAYLLHKYYKVSYLLKNLFTAYLGLNFFRTCHFILDCQHLNSFNIHTLWVPTLASHDPTFTLPLFTMVFTYFWLAKSRHPFMIHLIKPENFLYRVNIAFMTGLLFFPLPSIYAFGYLGWMAGHLLIRTLQHEGSDLREEWRDFFGLNKQFIEKRQRIDIENIKQETNLKAQQSQKEKDKK